VIDDAPKNRSEGRFAAIRPGLVRLAWVAGVGVAVALPLAVRAGWEGQLEMAAARVAASEGDLEAQMLHLGRAARWRLPLARHDEEAIDALLSLGEQLEAKGPEARETALVAYREVRRALLATRAWGVPQRDAFERANRRIAALMAAQEREFASDLSTSGDQEAWHLERLSQVPGPSSWKANLAALGFVGWVATAVGFVLFSVDAQGRLRPRPAIRWGATMLVLLVAWMILTRVA